MRSLSIPGHVHHGAGEHGGSVLLNMRTGQWYAMNPVADALWRAWRSTGDFDSAITAMAAEYPDASPDHIRQDAQTLAKALAERGLVVLDGPVPPGPPPAECDLPGTPVIAAIDDVHAAPWRRAMALCAFVVAVLLLRLPFRATVAVVTGLRHVWCRRAAHTADVALAIATVRKVSGWFPGRVACLETSLAVLLAMTLQRRSVDWIIGVAQDPYRFHAWTEVDGIPVIGDYDSGFEQFRRVLRI